MYVCAAGCVLQPDKARKRRHSGVSHSTKPWRVHRVLSQSISFRLQYRRTYSTLLFCNNASSVPACQLNAAESVNFASLSWLAHGRAYFNPTPFRPIRRELFSHDKLLLALARPSALATFPSKMRKQYVSVRGRLPIQCVCASGSKVPLFATRVQNCVGHSAVDQTRAATSRATSCFRCVLCLVMMSPSSF